MPLKMPLQMAHAAAQDLRRQLDMAEAVAVDATQGEVAMLRDENRELHGSVDHLALSVQHSQARCCFLDSCYFGGSAACVPPWSG